MADSFTTDPDRKKGMAATGGVLGAVLLSSCCIAPLVLITLGASGAWIGQLTAMKAYQPIFLLFTTGFLGYGFWRVYGKLNQQCADESCATPRSDRILKVVLWAATGVVLLAMTTDFWAPFFY